MNHKEIAAAVVGLLQGSGKQEAHWIHPPEVTHIPFMGSRKRFFLLVSLYVKKEATGREGLVNDCLTVARVVIGSGFLAGEKAVEIAVFIENQKRLRRVARLTVLDTTFEQVLDVKATDVLNQRVDGITCQWPLQS